MQNKKISISLVASFLLATNLYSNELYISSATKSEQSIKDVTSNVEVITSDDIEEKNYTDIKQVLNSVSGISFFTNGSLGNSTEVFLRGMDTQRILVLIDGIKYQDPSNTSGASFENIMINNIERIEIIKGPQSGIWGADASAGVINIITKKEKIGMINSIGIEVGSYNTKKVTLNTSRVTDKYDFNLGFLNINTDGFSSKSTRYTDVDLYEKDGYRNTSVNAGFGYKLTDTDKISFYYNNINTKVEYDAADANDSSATIDNQSNLYNITYSKIIKEHSIKVKYDLSKFEKETSTGTARELEGEINSFEINDSIKYFKNDNIVIGYTHENSNAYYLKNDNTSEEKDTYNDSFFITNTNKLFDRLVFSQSIRNDKYSNFGSELTGKLGLKYNFTNELIFRTNYGTAYNAPNIIRILNPWGTTNPDLGPEKTKGYDVSFDYKNFKLTYFKNDVKDLIEWNNSQYQNLDGTATLRGYEASYKKDILKDTFLSLNYSHLSAVDEQKRDLKKRPKDQIDISVDYYGLKKTHININGSYVGTRYNGDNKTGTQTGRYTVWNSVVNYDINKNLKTYLKIDNLFDKYYQTVDGYSTSPRAFYVGLKATF